MFSKRKPDLNAPWRSMPSSFDLDLNKPNGKSCQKYYFTKPWEAKHAIGVQHKKRQEFEARDGIRNVHLVERYQSNLTKNPEDCTRFTIEGTPSAVNLLMADISKWLIECQKMHYSDY